MRLPLTAPLHDERAGTSRASPEPPPRALAAFGLAATLISITAVVMPLLGYRFVFLMLIPVSLSQLALIAWLLARGFAEGRQWPSHGTAGAVVLGPA